MHEIPCQFVGLFAQWRLRFERPDERDPRDFVVFLVAFRLLLLLAL